ncbi:hypothetical protein [Pseudoalteromonas sp. MMG012]|uniref:hypothetical protein n=1 Tax=Pseudoalteromonas sp. MMG012 TaxID=2822686 RepID=UPI001B3A2471|nr:hypothetical protein [Pseudoalteromonas sp. MMG012]MBQ4852178.1 hypothetical protein [Pseudoalteromonas sp. MMG012]
MMIKILTPICAALVLSGCIVHVGGAAAKADKHETQQLAVSTAGLTSLDANLGAGSLKVIGAPNLSEIKVDADIYTYDGSGYTFTLDTSGSTAKLIAETSSRSGNVWVVGNQSPRIDLVVYVPETMALDINDGSGDIHIQGITSHINIEDNSGGISINGGHNINIDDGSGDININGGYAIDIKDGSGSLDISQAQGDIHIVDGSGDMKVHDTVGEIYIKDGSGSLNIKNAQGNISINDGSGDLNVYRAQKNVEIEDDSGSISVAKIAGKVTIEDGSGDIEVNHAGSLHISDAGSGSVSIDNIKGRISGDLNQ